MDVVSENETCPTCHFKVEKKNHTPDGATNFQNIAISTGNKNSLMVYMEDSKSDYAIVYADGEGPAFNTTSDFNDHSIQDLLNMSDDNKVSVSIELGRIKDTAVMGAYLRVRNSNPGEGTMDYHFGQIKDTGKVVFGHGDKVTWVWGVKSFDLTEELQNLTVVFDFNNELLYYYLDGELIAIYKDPQGNLKTSYNEETGKYTLKYLSFTGTDGTSLNFRANNFGYLKIGEMSIVSGDITEFVEGQYKS